MISFIFALLAVWCTVVGFISFSFQISRAISAAILKVNDPNKDSMSTFVFSLLAGTFWVLAYYM